MTKRLKKIKKYIFSDTFYNNLIVSKFINIITISGKKNISKKIFYKTIEYLNGFNENKNGIYIFYEALNNACPMLEIRIKKISGSIYNIPIEISNKRRINTAMR